MALDLTNTLLSGFVMLFIGLLAYETGYRWFKPFGDHRFTSKNGAQVTLILFVFATGLIADPVFTIVKSGTTGLSNVQQLGIILVVSRIAANAVVPNWVHEDATSVLMYLIGGVMVVFGGG